MTPTTVISTRATRSQFMDNSVRNTIALNDSMHRFFSEMERNLFSAEIICSENEMDCTKCMFDDDGYTCKLDHIREIIGVASL
jgi:hypothetical protein